MEKKYQRKQLFEKICMLHDKELQRFIYTLTRNDQFAMEEIYQNTMLEALKGLDCLRNNNKMKNWIFSIAKAEAKRYYAAKNKNEHGVKTGEQSDFEYMFDFTKYVEDIEYLKSLIINLSEEERQLYVLHYYYGVSLKEISEIFNSNYNTVRSMHIRGMAKMKKQHVEVEALYG